MSKFIMICVIGVLLVGNFYKIAFGEVSTASWYSENSCKKEGTWQEWGGLTASGERFNENDLTCAMWHASFGTLVRVTNLANGKSVVVRVNDRGPARRLVKRGRVIDLSKGAFQRIANLKDGVINVKLEMVERE